MSGRGLTSTRLMQRLFLSGSTSLVLARMSATSAADTLTAITQLLFPGGLPTHKSSSAVALRVRLIAEVAGVAKCLHRHLWPEEEQPEREVVNESQPESEGDRKEGSEDSTEESEAPNATPSPGQPRAKSKPRVGNAKPRSLVVKSEPAASPAASERSTKVWRIWKPVDVDQLQQLVARGQSNPQIAATLGRTQRSVERKLQQLRKQGKLEGVGSKARRSAIFKREPQPQANGMGQERMFDHEEERVSDREENEQKNDEVAAAHMHGKHPSFALKSEDDVVMEDHSHVEDDNTYASPAPSTSHRVRAKRKSVVLTSEDDADSQQAQLEAQVSPPRSKRRRAVLPAADKSPKLSPQKQRGVTPAAERRIANSTRSAASPILSPAPQQARWIEPVDTSSDESAGEDNEEQPEEEKTDEDNEDAAAKQTAEASITRSKSPPVATSRRSSAPRSAGDPKSPQTKSAPTSKSAAAKKSSRKAASSSSESSDVSTSSEESELTDVEPIPPSNPTPQLASPVSGQPSKQSAAAAGRSISGISLHHRISSPRAAPPQQEHSDEDEDEREHSPIALPPPVKKRVAVPIPHPPKSAAAPVKAPSSSKAHRSASLNGIHISSGSNSQQRSFTISESKSNSAQDDDRDDHDDAAADAIPSLLARQSASQSSGDLPSNDNFCNLCGKQGQLLVCDRCPRAYHELCLVVHNPQNKQLLMHFPSQEDFACKNAKLRCTGRREPKKRPEDSQSIVNHR